MVIHLKVLGWTVLVFAALSAFIWLDFRWIHAAETLSSDVGWQMFFGVSPVLLAGVVCVYCGIYAVLK